MFVDEVVIKVIAGSGGDGIISYRREKYIPMGGPFGGNGGKGSDIIFTVDEGLHTLLDLRFAKKILGKKGEPGQSKNCQGKSSEDIIVRVPQGTVITDLDTGLILADLKGKNDRVIVASGGRGGRGNTAFKSQSNPAPNYCELGEPGEIRNLKVEIKLLADVGLVGMPSVGKSTIIGKVSASKAKVAAYHFTTLSPNLGVVKTLDNRIFVMADLPGLIEGASLGEGLGDKFLRHIERTKVIAHVIDMAGSEGRDPYQDYLIINKELNDFNPKILKKPQIIVANKMDLETFKSNLIEFKKKVKLPVYEISAVTGKGLDELLIEIANLLDKQKEEPLYEDEAFESHVLYKFKKEEPYTITKDKDVWVVRGDDLEKLLRMTKFSTQEGELRFANKLRRMGVDEKLEKLGAEDGDLVRILDFEFEYRS
ncbi:MAG: GTPase ObgE [Bacilli bacterium]